MFKKNLIRQEGYKDCGPSCLLMIIKHYKGYVDIEELKEMCKTDKNGTTAYHLIEAAKKCGFESYGIKCSLEDINKENIILPCIAHVIINNSYKHYVVIEKIDFKRKRLLIKDPIGQIKYYSFVEFKEIYNNVLVYLYPNQTIKYNPPISLKKYLLSIIASSTKHLLQIIIISLFILIFSIITTFYMQNMIDNMYSKSKIIFIFILFLLVSCFKVISDFLRNKIIILVNQKIDLNLTYNTFKHIMNLPYRYYRNHTTGEIISKINDLDVVRQVISKLAVSLFIDFPLTIISLIVIYILNFNLFIISLVMLFLYILVLILFRNKFNEHIDTCITDRSLVTSYMVESINGFETIKGCNMESKVMKKFENKYCTMSNEIYDFENCNNIQYLLKEIINNIGFLIIILIGTILVMNNEITIGQLLTFNALFTYFLEPIRNVIDLDSSYKQAKTAVRKILKLYYSKESSGIIDKPFKGNIKFNKVSYSFDDVNYVLKNIDLEIEEKSKVMVIGESGSGKSTLFKMLKKYYDIPRNKILIDDIDINDYISSDVIYVSQNEILFTDTIKNNIDSDDIIKLSKICLVDDIIKSQLGYNTLIEENGFNLSGGEKQRIILARALANNFNILIIDEGLSQVDINMERKIIKNLFNNYKDKTIIFISHRLDNMDLFDRVIKIEKGKIESDLSKH